METPNPVDLSSKYLAVIASSSIAPIRLNSAMQSAHDSSLCGVPRGAPSPLRRFGFG